MQTPTKKMRVLILADSCNPEWPSLPVVGYKAAKAIAEHADVTVLTQVRNRENIAKHGFGKAEVDYIDNEYVAGPVYKLLNLLRGQEGSWTTVMAAQYPNYLAFELEVWRRYGAALRAGEFDIVHRITPMSPTLPSFIASRCPVPFVIGPLNGGLKWPEGFDEQRKKEKEWLTPIRQVYRWLPYRRSTLQNAAAILASFDHTIEDIPPQYRHKVFDFPEIGIDPELFNANAKPPAGEARTILYVGRLVPYKLPDLVVRAFAASPLLRRHKLKIIGDGPMRPQLEAIIQEHQLSDCVTLAGRLPQQQVGEEMRGADIFAFPSIRELGAGALAEAMACGLACAVVDHGAPGALVNADCGIKIAVSGRQEMQRQFTAALEELTQSPRLQELGHHAHERALGLFSWERKARETIKIYEWIFGQRQQKPDFWEEHSPPAALRDTETTAAPNPSENFALARPESGA